MKKILLALIIALAFIVSPITSQAITVYNCTALTGGAARALDTLSVADLADGDRCIVVDTSVEFLLFEYDSAAVDAEDTSTHPYKVRPDDFVAAGVWIECNLLNSITDVLRKSLLTIDNATVAAEIKCTLASRWNGDTIAVTDNIGTGETVGDFTLNGAGNVLKIEVAGLTANTIAVIASYVNKNLSATALSIGGIATGNDIQLSFYNAATGAALDLGTLVDTGIITVEISYVSAN